MSNADDMKQPFALTEADLDQVEKLVRAGAEPFWMQDIRLAQRSIEAERARLRAAQSSSSSEAERGSLDDPGSK